MDLFPYSVQSYEDVGKLMSICNAIHAPNIHLGILDTGVGH